MDARYTIRRAPLLEECQGAPEVFEQGMPRLPAFMAPLVDTLQGKPLGMRRPTSEACSRMLDARMWKRLRLIWARTAWGCKA